MVMHGDSDSEKLSDLRSKVEAFICKYSQCEPYIISAFAFQQNHGIAYKGPQFAVELMELKEAVK